MANTREIRQRQVPADLEHRKSSKASVVLAGLAILPLMMAGQPWGVVYGLGLRVAKGVVALGSGLAVAAGRVRADLRGAAVE